MLLNIEKGGLVMKFLIAGFWAVATTGCSVIGIQGVDEPAYRVIAVEGKKEIRLYEPYIVAKTTVDGSYREAQSKGFRILAGYIFGGNKKQEEIAMTAPVTSEVNSEQIAMTAPVVQSKVDDKWLISFVMPERFESIDQMPQPNDSRISFSKVLSRYAAVLKFTWFSSKERNQELADELLTWVKTQPEYKPLPPFKIAGYDPPWTIPFLRRNEIILDLQKNCEQGTDCPN